MKQDLQVAYIEGRPKGHPMHSSYAKSVNGVFHFVDFRLRYHDSPSSLRIKRYLSWLVCALTFPKRKKYDVFLSEEAYFMLGLMKKLGLISANQKLIAIMGSHTLYFLYTNQYKPSTKKAFIKLFNLYDAFICEGDLQVNILNILLGNTHTKKIYKIFNGNPAIRFDKLLKIEPDFEKLNILTIGAIPNKERVFYKGVDLMLSAFETLKLNIKYKNVTFTIVGEYDKNMVAELLNTYCPKSKESVIFLGQSEDLSIQLKEADLYLHIARGEAWGISVTEAMLAGIPPIVSELTGSKEVVNKVSSE